MGGGGGRQVKSENTYIDDDITSVNDMINGRIYMWVLIVRVLCQKKRRKRLSLTDWPYISCSRIMKYIIMDTCKST